MTTRATRHQIPVVNNYQYLSLLKKVSIVVEFDSDSSPQTYFLTCRRREEGHKKEIREEEIEEREVGGRGTFPV